jgi:hypothetical protein
MSKLALFLILEDQFRPIYLVAYMVKLCACHG